MDFQFCPFTAFKPVLFGLTSLSLFFIACGGGSQAPLNADTKKTIDSLTTVGIREARNQQDTICKQLHQTLLPRLVDSIRNVREAEIREALKNLPK